MIITTNRELYLALANLAKEQSNSTRSLEEYLRALWLSVLPHRDANALSLDQFYEFLANAYVAEIAPFEEAWRGVTRLNPRIADGFPSWQSTILPQIVDLREMAEQNILNDSQRYFGINAPRAGLYTSRIRRRRD